MAKTVEVLTVEVSVEMAEEMKREEELTGRSTLDGLVAAWWESVASTTARGPLAYPADPDDQNLAP